MKIEIRIKKCRYDWSLVACKFLYAVDENSNYDFGCFVVSEQRSTTTKKLEENKRFFLRFEKYLEV
jgi:hypothetical protein